MESRVAVDSFWKSRLVQALIMPKSRTCSGAKRLSLTWTDRILRHSDHRRIKKMRTITSGILLSACGPVMGPWIARHRCNQFQNLLLFFAPPCCSNSFSDRWRCIVAGHMLARDARNALGQRSVLLARMLLSSTYPSVDLFCNRLPKLIIFVILRLVL